VYEWSSQLEVGVDTIDAQHRELFRAINSLLQGEGDKAAAPEEIPGVIAFLEDYVVNHFGMEEVYMRRLTYPGYPVHKNEHVAFISRFYDIRDEFDADGGNPEIADRLAHFLGDWLINHIGKVDKALGQFLRDRSSRALGPISREKGKK
jgi:hemerythrin-like metal-binding protein